MWSDLLFIKKKCHALQIPKKNIDTQKLDFGKIILTKKRLVML